MLFAQGAGNFLGLPSMAYRDLRLGAHARTAKTHAAIRFYAGTRRGSGRGAFVRLTRPCFFQRKQETVEDQLRAAACELIRPSCPAQRRSKRSLIITLGVIQVPKPEGLSHAE